jgi:neutral ceramidase
LQSMVRLAAGGVSYRHRFVDMTKVVVEESNFTRAGKTCPAAMGFSFAAGTTDGVSQPSCFSFTTGQKGRLRSHL